MLSKTARKQVWCLWKNWDICTVMQGVQPANQRNKNYWCRMWKLFYLSQKTWWNCIVTCNGCWSYSELSGIRRGWCAWECCAGASVKINLRTESVWESTVCLCWGKQYRRDEWQERLSWDIDWGANATNNSSIVILRSGNFLLWPLN